MNRVATEMEALHEPSHTGPLNKPNVTVATSFGITKLPGAKTDVEPLIENHPTRLGSSITTTEMHGISFTLRRGGECCVNSLELPFTPDTNFLSLPIVLLSALPYNTLGKP